MPLNEETYRAILDGMLHAHSRQLDRLEDELHDLRSNLLALGHDVASLRAATELLAAGTMHTPAKKPGPLQAHAPKP